MLEQQEQVLQVPRKTSLELPYEGEVFFNYGHFKNNVNEIVAILIEPQVYI